MAPASELVHPTPKCRGQLPRLAACAGGATGGLRKLAHKAPVFSGPTAISLAWPRRVGQGRTAAGVCCWGAGNAPHLGQGGSFGFPRATACQLGGLEYGPDLLRRPQTGRGHLCLSAPWPPFRSPGMPAPPTQGTRSCHSPTLRSSCWLRWEGGS